MTHRVAVLFDLDDTLYDEITFVYGAMRAVAQFLATRGPFDEDDVDRRLRNELARAGRGRVFNQVLADLGLPARLVPTLVHVYRSARPPLRLLPDADAVLRQLNVAGVPAGVLTDGNALVQGTKIDMLGLRRRLDVMVLTDAVGRGAPKPDPLGFQIACDVLDLPPAAVFYVANDLRKDFRGPRRLGMPTIHVTQRQLGTMDGLSDDDRPAIVVGTVAEAWPYIRGRMETG